MSANAVHGTLVVCHHTFQSPAGLLLSRLQYALCDLDILQWQVELLGIKLLGFGAKPLLAPFADDAFQPPLSLAETGTASASAALVSVRRCFRVAFSSARLSSFICKIKHMGGLMPAREAPLSHSVAAIRPVEAALFDPGPPQVT
jgi:hypothetical protein